MTVLVLRECIEERLDELIPRSSAPLLEAARYALLGNGKRLRPLLVLAAASCFGEDPLQALDIACAIEMIHTYSLIHDDLPCMDNDDFRRGKPTLHKIYGEALALLAGDYLLTYAFETVAQSEYLGDAEKISILKVLSRRCGAGGLVGGQAIDILSEGKAISEATLVQMHKEKTGALLSCCIECGAIASKAPASIFPLLHSLGEDLGLAYQFRDDYLDAAEAENGKNKPTAVSLFGLEGTQKRLNDLEKSIEEKLLRFPSGELTELVKMILQRNS